MKALLMHRERDFDAARAATRTPRTCVQDLELGDLSSAMAAGDEFLHRDRRVGAAGEPRPTPRTIPYRQAVLATACATRRGPGALRARGARRSTASSKRLVRLLRAASPGSSCTARSRSWTLFVEYAAGGCATLAEEHAGEFAPRASHASSRCSTRSLTTPTWPRSRRICSGCSFRGGGPGQRQARRGQQGSDYVLPQPPERRSGCWSGSPARRDRPELHLPAARARRGRRPGPDRAARARHHLVANALGAADRPHHRASSRCCGPSSAFYVGCLNLHEQLARKGEPICVPEPSAPGAGAL